MTMRKRGMLMWAFIALALPSWCADFWDGNAAILKGDARFESGAYAASNSFPADTEIQVQNLDNQKTVTAIVTQRIAGQSDILVFLSPKAGESLGMTQGRMNRVRVKVPVKTAVPTAAIAEDRVENPDPDTNPSAGMAQPARAAAASASASKQAVSETPERPSADAQVPAVKIAEKAGPELPAPVNDAAADAVTDVASGPVVPRASEIAASTTPDSTPAPETSKPPAAPETAAVAAPETAPTETEPVTKPQESTTTETVQAKSAGTGTTASGQPSPDTSHPPALDELLGRVPQKRLFLPPREDEAFAYRKPVQPPARPEPLVTREPAKEPVKETASESGKEPIQSTKTPVAKEPEKQPAQEPVKTASQEPAVAQASETPIASGILTPSASRETVPDARIAEIPFPPSDSYEVGNGVEPPYGEPKPRKPGHEPVAVEAQPSAENATASEISDSTPENPVWTPYVADLEPTEPNPPVEEKPTPDASAVETPVESGPEATGIASTEDMVIADSGMPTGVSETPQVASEAPLETASDVRPAGAKKMEAVAAKPVDQPKEPVVDTAVKTAPEAAVKTAPEAAVVTAAESAVAVKPVDTVVTMERTEEKPPAGTQKPVEKAAPEKAVEKPAVASKPPTGMPLKPSTLKPGEYYLQLAAYATESIAQETIRSLAATYPVGLLPPVEKGRPLYRVVVGPLNKAESGTLLNRFRFSGFPDAFLKPGE